jgi:hypothetical protein
LQDNLFQKYISKYEYCFLPDLENKKRSPVSRKIKYRINEVSGKRKFLS